MLGKRDPQRKLFGARVLVGKSLKCMNEDLGFYGELAKRGPSLLRDEDFADAYCADNGRPSVPPSILSIARLLQHYEGISDAQVIERCRFDIRWKIALDLELTSVEAPFAKSTFQAFRARLTLHRKEGLAFERSVEEARKSGLLPKQLTVALDSSPVRGRGAVKDTFNLLSDAIVAVIRSVARKMKRAPEDVAADVGVTRHFEAASIKASEVVDWGDKSAVEMFLGGLIVDCRQVVRAAAEAECATQDVALLQKVIEQDVEVDASDDSARLHRGVAKDRTISIHDPEMRHGRKSSGTRYAGHKAHVAVEVTTGVITAVDVSAPAAADGAQVGALIDETETITDTDVIEAFGDAAYGSRDARKQAKARVVELTTKMPGHKAGKFGPADFQVSRSGKTARCPRGIESRRRSNQGGGYRHVWSADACRGCVLREQCTTARARTLSVPPDFHARRAREDYARSAAGRAKLRLRVTVEHAIARLKHRGAGTARYFGRARTKAQWQWTAAVANLSLAWNRQAKLSTG